MQNQKGQNQGQQGQIKNPSYPQDVNRVQGGREGGSDFQSGQSGTNREKIDAPSSDYESRRAPNR